MLALKSGAVWLGILACAFLNGALRELFLVPFFGQPAANLASGVLLSLLIVAVAFLALPWLGRLSTWKAMLVGILWLCLTLLFEFGFGLFVQGKSLSMLLQAYAFKEGNLWPLVLLVTAVAPVVAARFRS